MKGKNKNNQGKTIPYLDVESLIKRRNDELPASGDYLFDYKLEALKKQLADAPNEELAKKVKIKFSDLPISKFTLAGLIKRKFFVMTEVQRCILPHALGDRDILGASKTGSGKTLCYLLPVIEKLYINKFTPLDGLGALIILPTRELALQVFEVLSSILTNHPHLSMGLVIGGKNIKYEQEKINRMNILIATPGRLLQHMNESIGFDATNLKILVLDEVDMILEMGFINTLNAIIKNIPKERQTLLFSATLSKSIHDLVKLSLRKPEYISLHEAKANIDNENDVNSGKNYPKPLTFEVPKGLVQFYMMVKLEDKLDTLFSFLRSHPKSKSLVFFSSIKQVRFAYEAFKKLNLSRSLPLFDLHGKMKQPQRMAIFFGFKEKKYASLFTTNVAARGLDFPFIDWVIQVDCPEDTSTYIHRVGRTARFKAEGKSLLLLMPSEEKFIDKIKAKGLELKRIFPNPNKSMTIKSSLQSLVTEDVTLKHLAQKAFISYVRSVYLSADKEVFDLSKFDTTEFAASLGLIQTPVIKFGDDSEAEEEDDDDNDNEDEKAKEKGNDSNETKNKPKSKLAKLKAKIKEKKMEKLLLKQAENQNTNVAVPEKESELIKNTKEDDNDDDFLVPKKKTEALDPNKIKVELKVSKNQLKKIHVEGGLFNGRNKILFDKDGNEYTAEEMKTKKIKTNNEMIINSKIEPVYDYIARVEANREVDTLEEKQRLREKRLKKKLKLKKMRTEQLGEANAPTLAYDRHNEDDADGDNGDNNQEEDNHSDESSD